MNREQTTIRLPADLKEQIQHEADARGQTLNGLIRQILWDWVKKEKEVQK